MGLRWIASWRKFRDLLENMETQSQREERTILAWEEPWSGKRWWDHLGYQNGSRDIKRHVDEEDKTFALIQGEGSAYKRYAVLVSESGGCSVIISSKLPQAKVFKRGAPTK